MGVAQMVRLQPLVTMMRVVQSLMAVAGQPMVAAPMVLHQPTVLTMKDVKNLSRHVMILRMVAVLME